MTHIDDAVLLQVQGLSLLPRLALPDRTFPRLSRMSQWMMTTLRVGVLLVTHS